MTAVPLTRLKIAESFPGGRGDAQGCAARALFCRDAACARPRKPQGIRRGDREAAIFLPERRDC